MPLIYLIQGLVLDIKIDTKHTILMGYILLQLVQYCPPSSMYTKMLKCKLEIRNVQLDLHLHKFSSIPKTIADPNQTRGQRYENLRA